MTVEEAARELGLETQDVVYRLVRMGTLPARKIGRRWDIAPEAVAERKRKVAHKRSSRVHAAAERARRVEVAQSGFVSIA
jgi:excisionase family DNA binding protein